MYETYYQLTARPFATAPDPEAYFPGESIESAREAVVRCVERSAGVALVVGAAGTGKTLLGRVLERQFSDAFEVVRLRGGDVTSRRSLFQAILRSLKLPYRMDEGELRLALADYVEHGTSRGAGLVILVDEAQSLPIGLLEELRLMTNLHRGEKTWVHVVFFGGPELEERFASPKLESLSQRLAARCYLQPLSKAETRSYVAARIVACGGEVESIFSDDALEQIYHAADGVPRRINQVCDHALVLAYAGGVRPIDGPGIEEAWADLQQLPLPAARALQAEEDAPQSIVEFGDLCDEEETPGMLVPAPMPSAATPQPTAIASTNLERIEAHLGRLEQEFRHESGREPGVRFAFHEPRSKSAEAFEHEEVLVDRYAKPAAAAKPAPSGNSHAQSGWPPLPMQPVPNAAAAPLAGEENDDDMIVVEEDAATLPMHGGKRPPVRRREYGQLFAKLRRG